MNIKRTLIYNVYNFLKKIGYIHFKNSSSNYSSIITYHRVNDYDSEPLTISTAIFDSMMREISGNYHAGSLQTLINIIKNKEPLDPKMVVVTFDDGYKDNFTNAVPILKKYNIPATFFITSGYINTNRVFPWDNQSGQKYSLMTWDEVRELASLGFDIGSHTINHVNLGKVSADIARKEIIGSKEQIEKEINKKINKFAYPYGKRNYMRDEIREIVREAGFDCCCAAYGGKITVNTNLYNVFRIATYPNTVELLMEIDNFMTYFDNKIKISIF